jgi:hypothetical protein
MKRAISSGCCALVAASVDSPSPRGIVRLHQVHAVGVTAACWHAVCSEPFGEVTAELPRAISREAVMSARSSNRRKQTETPHGPGRTERLGD